MQGDSSLNLISDEMSHKMQIVKRELIAQDLNRVKQILTLVEEGVTNELASIALESARKFDAPSEFAMIKSLFIAPVLASTIDMETATESTTISDL